MRTCVIIHPLHLELETAKGYGLIIYLECNPTKAKIAFAMGSPTLGQSFKIVKTMPLCFRMGQLSALIPNSIRLVNPELKIKNFLI